MSHSTATRTKRIGSLLKTYQSEFADAYHLIATINKGVSTSIVAALENELQISKEQLAARLQVSPRTIDNYKAERKGTTLNAHITERALLLLKLYNKGAELFDNIENFNQWLEKPSYGLNGKIPQDLLNTTTGLGLVMKELTKIEHGDFS